MAIINVIPRRSYSFTTTTTTTLATNLDVSQVREGTLVLRLHANGLGSGSSGTVNVRMIAPSREEPSVEFVHSTAIATAAIASGDAVGFVGRGAFTANFGAFVKVELLATKGAGACDFTISVDLVTKD